jgi:transcriptional regulator with XRE-family HTH domain
LRFERNARQISQASVATATGIHQPLISAIERGRLIPSPEQLQRLADVFHVRPEDLLRDVVVLGPRR